MNAAAPAVLRLTVGASATMLVLDEPAAAPCRWDWPMGHASLWSDRPGSPSPVMIENAIQRVEDQIELVARHVPAGARLVASAATLAPLQREGAIAGLHQGAITLAQIEREVQSLAARSMGVPSARARVFDDPAGDALVLILRECLHHLGLDAVHLQD
jgi:hypothetical protein